MVGRLKGWCSGIRGEGSERGVESTARITHNMVGGLFIVHRSGDHSPNQR